ncbi:helix-turn-helix domain-containing protein [Burkholderia cepacia]|nr:helix-turn-helix domain-containing protein [Burkholderia cepacia]
MEIQIAITDLLRSGLTQAQLAGMIPCSQSLVSALLNGARGARTSHKIASRIIELHGSRVTFGQRKEIA